MRPKYACRYCKDGVSSPPPPDRPIARGIAGPGLITQIVVSKFGDHLPLYRQEDIFVRHGLHIARGTQCDWVAAAADLLKPLYDLQQRQVLQSSVMWTDDTPVTALTGDERGSCKGRFWTYVGDNQHPYSVYDFTMTRIRDRYSLEVTENVFAFVLKLAADNRLISGTTVGVDSTQLEANAAMKSIVRKDTGEDWKDYLRRLMLAEGLIDEDDQPSDEELVRFDRARKGKKVSNKDWESPTDEDARITRMKDGRTRLGVKAEHTVDLETEVILSSTVMHSTQPDHHTLIDSVGKAQLNL